MPILECPVKGCDWKSQELSDAFATALTTALQMHHADAHGDKSEGQHNTSNSQSNQSEKPSTSKSKYFLFK